MDEEFESVIYTGPSKRELGLKRYQVFNNKPPEYIEAMRDKYDIMSGAFVTLSEFAEGQYIHEGTEDYKRLCETLNGIARGVK